MHKKISCCQEPHFLFSWFGTVGLIFFLICSNFIYPADRFTVETIKKVRESLNRIKPFRVDFVQQVASESKHNAAIDLEESGDILFKNDQQLRWVYLKPDYKVFLLEGDKYRFYDQDNEQITIGRIKDRSHQWIWQLLFSDDVFRFASAKEKEKPVKIRIKNDAESLNVEISVTQDFLPSQVIQVDPSGARMIYYFKNYHPNVAIPDNAFQLNVPNDVETIYDEDGENKDKI